MTDQELKDLVASNAIGQAKANEQWQRAGERIEKLGERIDKLGALLGSSQKNLSDMLEEFLHNSVFQTAREDGTIELWGIMFDYIVKSMKNRIGKIEGEFDFALFNCDSIALVEVKNKAHINDLAKFPRMIANFRTLFPMYKDYQIYIGIASMHINDEIVQECRENGYGVIKIAGEVVEPMPLQVKAF